MGKGVAFQQRSLPESQCAGGRESGMMEERESMAGRSVFCQKRGELSGRERGTGSCLGLCRGRSGGKGWDLVQMGPREMHVGKEGGGLQENDGLERF